MVFEFQEKICRRWQFDRRWQDCRRSTRGFPITPTLWRPWSIRRILSVRATRGGGQILKFCE